MNDDIVDPLGALERLFKAKDRANKLINAAVEAIESIKEIEKNIEYMKDDVEDIKILLEQLVGGVKSGRRRTSRSSSRKSDEKSG